MRLAFGRAPVHVPHRVGRSHARVAELVVARHVGDVHIAQGQRGGHAVVPDVRDHDHQPGHRADNQRVDKGLQQGHHTLGDRLVSLGGRMRDRGRALTCFVREQSALHAIGERGQQHPHAGAGHPGRRIEGLAEDRPERRQHMLQIGKDDQKRTGHVEPGHQGRQHARHGADATDAADDDQPNDDRRNQASDPGLNPKSIAHLRGDRVGLHRIARHERRDHEHEGKKDGHRLPPQPFFDVVHGAAGHRTGPDLAVRLDGHAVVQRERHLAVLGGHAQESRHPHPEQRPGSTHVDGDGHARDVTDPHRGRKRRGERLKVRDVAGFIRIVVLPGSHGKAVRQLTELNETKPQRQKQPGAQQSDHQNRRQKAVNLSNYVAEKLHGACFLVPGSHTSGRTQPAPRSRCPAKQQNSA